MAEKNIFDVNGLRVVFYQIRDINSVSICIKVKLGSWFEGEKWGRAHLLEHMLFQSTGRFSTKEARENFCEDNGIVSNAITFGSNIEITFKFPKDNLDSALMYISEMVFHPMINKEAIETEKKIIEREFQDKWSKIEKTFNYKINQQIFGSNHQYARDGIGQIGFVKETTEGDLQELHRRYFLPSNMVMSVAGNIDSNSFIEKIKTVFSETSHEEIPEINVPNPESDKTALVLEEVGRKSTLLRLSWLIDGVETLTIKERFSLRLFSYILGGGMRSILFKEIRDRLGLAYNIGSNTGFYPKAGWFQVTSSVDPNDVDLVIDKIKRIIEVLAEKGVEDEVFERSKKFLKYQVVLDFDSSYGASQALCTNLFWDGKYLSPEEYAEIVDSIQMEEMKALVKKYLKGADSLVALLKPKSP